MKKLAGTSWGANGSILQKVYMGTVRPVVEYGMTAWASASKTNTDRLSKVQNSGLRLISGGMKTTPIHAMEKHVNIRPLDDRREERVLVQREKIKCMPNHPMHVHISRSTTSRLKRTSFCHISDHLHQQHKDILTNN